MDDIIEADRRGVLKAAAAALALGGLAASPASAQSRARRVATGRGRRMLGRLEVSELGLGVQNMSRTFQTTIPKRSAMHALIRAAFDQGITFFDTAEVYGPHECERILGEATVGFRDEIQIATKFGFNVNLETGAWQPGVISRPAHIKQAVEGSLRRLRTDRVELLYQHRVDPEVPIEDVAGAVADLIQEGKVLHWGLSEMGPQTLLRAHAALPVSAVQSEYSLLWRGREADIVPICAQLGVGFVPFAPLGYGFLTGAIDMQTSFAPGDFRSNTTRMDPENREANLAVVALARAWAEQKDAEPGQIALAWLMAQHPSIVPIPGTTQMPHLLENNGARTVRFTDAELAAFTSALDAIEVRGDRAPPFVAAWSDVEAPLPG